MTQLHAHRHLTGPLTDCVKCTPLPTTLPANRSLVPVVASQAQAFHLTEHAKRRTTVSRPVFASVVWIAMLTGFAAGTARAQSDGNKPFIDKSLIPPGSKGYSDLRVVDADLSDPINWPVPEKTGAFGVPCDFSHMNFDDPIVFPGEPGRSHLHTFFGNTDTDAYSNADSLSKTGNSTCSGGIMNRTGYWVPSLVDTRNGAPVAPEGAIIYYRTGDSGIPPDLVQPVPAGLRMIVGDHAASGDQDEDVYWDCLIEESIGHFATPPTEACLKAGGEYVFAKLTFPQCWDGVNLDSPNHKSHMANPEQGACPADHPVAIPAVSIFVPYLIKGGDEASYWRLSSDMYDPSLPGGASLHADYFYGWDDSFMQTLTKNCENASMDCHAHLLGDGRLYY